MLLRAWGSATPLRKLSAYFSFQTASQASAVLLRLPQRPAPDRQGALGELLGHGLEMGKLIRNSRHDLVR